jgi:integrase
VLPGLAKATQTKVDTVFNLFEKLTPVGRLAQLTTERVSLYQTRLRDGGRSEATISGYLAHLKAALRWAKRMNLLDEVPSIIRPKRAKKASAKGRDVTGEEFDRMINAVGAVVDADGVNADRVVVWKQLLQGLWHSGLRLGEALNLSWDSLHHLRIDMTGRYPALIIPAELEKGHKDRILPVTPGFAQLLTEVACVSESDFVFNPTHGTGKRASLDVCKRTIATIGEKAGVIVGRPPTKSGKAHKYASAHDLRRAFATRWAKRLMPQQLKELMRHESITTTLTHYAIRQADDIAALLWANQESGGLLNTSLNTAEKSSS